MWMLTEPLHLYLHDFIHCTSATGLADYIVAGVQTGVLNKVAVSVYNCFYKKVKVKPLRKHQVPIHDYTSNQKPRYILISWIKYLFDFCIFSNASAYIYVFIYLYASHYLYLSDL